MHWFHFPKQHPHQSSGYTWYWPHIRCYLSLLYLHFLWLSHLWSEISKGKVTSDAIPNSSNLSSTGFDNDPQCWIGVCDCFYNSQISLGVSGMHWSNIWTSALFNRWTDWIKHADGWKNICITSNPLWRVWVTHLASHHFLPFSAWTLILLMDDIHRT